MSAPTPPLLIVVIDTEEEFDWSKPFDRQANTVTALRHIDRVQDIFDQFGIAPVYVVDYPVADQPAYSERLKHFADDGRAVIGAHLHAWTCPPFEEEVTAHNSYQCNLPLALEREKLLRLIARIEDTFGLRPVVHKAGRYGFDIRSLDMLRELGFQYELSICAGYDCGADGGPDFSRYGAAPYWLDHEGGILALPTTAGFTGAAAGLGKSVYPLVASRVLEPTRLKAVCSRLGLLERIRLSPEGFSLDELKQVTRSLLDQGTRVLTFSFHSPSVVPGHTPYVASDDDLAMFLETCHEYFSFFRHDIGGTFSSPDGIRDAMTVKQAA